MATETKHHFTPAGDKVPGVDPCIITIAGRVYDLTHWAASHPGGPPIMIYNGREATDVFTAFHGPEAFELLKKFPSTPAPKVEMKTSSEALKTQNGGKEVCLKRVNENFEQLRKELVAEGFFNVSPFWFPTKFLTTVAFLPLAIYLNLAGWTTLAGVSLGMMWQQLGWVSHELLHHGVYKNRLINRLIAFVGGPILLGFSSKWWNERHNSHHAATNIDGSDPDIDNLPMLAWSASDVERATPEQRKQLKYQHYYFWFLLPLLNLAWGLASINFVKDVMATSKYSSYRNAFKYEACGIAFHFAWLAAFLIFTPSSFLAAVWCLVVAKTVAGAGLAFVVFFNHYSCPKLDFDSDAGENFVVMQLVSTRNLTPGVFTDWFCGGLNYQVEHHLFPTMPRPNLNRCSFRVRKFCKDNNLPYLCSDFLEGLDQVRVFLKDIADLA
jgi:delta8-fatty-acid desaturase